MIPNSLVIAPPEFDALSQWGIALIAVVVAVLWSWLLSNHDRRQFTMFCTLFGLLMGLTGLAAWSGQMSRFDFFPPPMLIMIVSVALVAFLFGLSRYGKAVAVQIPLSAMIGLQGFRFPLELVMHHAGRKGIMPVELSYSGYNYDILTGISALILLVLFKTGRKVPLSVLWAWNLWGSFCLVVIFFIAITTSPLVRLFGDSADHINTWVLYFPYIWLPVVLVTVAVSSHIVIWRQLMMKTNHQANSS